MKVIIGTVKELSGKFYAKDADGKVTELHIGDKILKGMVVYGAEGNSANAHVNIDVKSNGEILEVQGNQQQLFDLSLVQDHGNNGEFLSQKNIEQALDKTGVYAEDGATDNKEKAGNINDDETAAGSEAVVGHIQADQFALRDNAFVDVHSSLRDAHFNSPQESTLSDLNRESIIVDTTAPTAPTADISDATNSGSNTDTITNDNTPTITGKAEAGSTITIIDANGTVVGTATAGADGTYSVTTSQLPDGSNDLTVTATDTAGNVSASTSQSVTIDTTAPTITLNAPNLINDNTPVITGATNAVDGTTISLVVTDANGATQNFTTTANNGTYSADVPNSLPDGTYSATATVQDIAGNEATATDNNNGSGNTIDTTAPVVSVDSLVTSDTTPELTGKVDDPHAVVNVTIEGQSYEAKNNGDGTWTLPNDIIKEGTLDNVGIHDIAVQATDRAGNIATDTTTNELNIFKETNLGGPADGKAISFKITGDHYDPNNQQDVGVGSPKYQIFINGQAYKTSDGQSTFTVEANRGEVSKDGTHMLRDVPEFEIVTLNVPTGTPIDNVSIKFINDAWDGRNDNDKDGVFGEDRNLVVDKLNIAGTINADGTFSGGTTLEAEDRTTTQYLASNGHDVSGTEVMPWAGEMTFYPHGIAIATPKVTLDPSSDTGISNTDGITADNTPTVNIALGKGTASGDTINIKSDGKVVATHTVTDSEYRSGHANVSLNSLNDGQHAITAVVSNGTLTSDTASLDITIDTAAPDYTKLAITDIIDHNGDYSSVTMMGTGSQSGDTITLYDEQNTAVAKTAVNKDGSWSIDISNLKDTPINDNEFFKVTESDIVGNTTAQTDTVHYWHGEWTDTATQSTDDYVMSGAGNDTIHADAILLGTNENGSVAGSNDDTNDTLVIDGGEGRDTVIFGKEIGAYDIAVQNNGNITVTESAASDSNGDRIGDVTELRNVEMLAFADENHAGNGESTAGVINIDNHVLSLSGNSSIDFSNLESLSLDASKVTTIDLTKGDHTLSNLSLNDVLDMTDSSSNHTLTITGDVADSVNAISNDLDMGIGSTQWKNDASVDDTTTGTVTYNYSTNDGSNSLTLTVDENINHTGL